MASSGSKKRKTALVASLILNLAFFTGFVVKKINTFQGNEKAVSNTTEHGPDCMIDQHEVGYLHFCQRPGFREMFNSYQDWYRKVSSKMSQTKTAYLKELKKENADPAVLKMLLDQINRMDVKLNEENYRHLTSLKKVLSPEEFSALMDCMDNSLNAHRSHSFHSQPGPCTGTQNQEHVKNH